MYNNQSNTTQYGAGSTGGGNWAQMPGQLMQQGGQTGGQTAGQTGGQMAGGQMMNNPHATANLGAHEVLMTHEVLTHHIDSINLFELYRPHVKDQRLMQILDAQVNHMYTSYQNLVNFLHNRGGSSAVPYRVPKASAVKYGLHQPAPEHPNMNMNEMDDRDVASGIMSCAKTSAAMCTAAALECADPQLRSMMTNCTVSAINQAYETFQFLHEKGMYQVPTMAAQTTQTIVNAYQVGSQPQLR